MIFHYGKVTINNRLEEWYKLSWKDFFQELQFAGISMSNQTEEIYLRERFEEQKRRVLFIEDELTRHAEIISNNKIKI